MIETLAMGVVFYLAGVGSVVLFARMVPRDWRARAMLNRIVGRKPRPSRLGVALREPRPIRRRRAF